MMGVNASVPDRAPPPEGLLPATCTLLLAQLRDPANAALWNDFVSRYHTVVVSFCRGMGVAEEDAIDIAQQTMLEVVRDYRAGGFDRGRGRLRSWIFGIARHRVLDWRHRQRRLRAFTSDRSVEELVEDDSLSRKWELAEERATFQEALRLLERDTRVGETTIRAFMLFAIEGKDVRAVADACGISTSQVYVAKHRMLERIRETMERLRAGPDEAP